VLAALPAGRKLMIIAPLSWNLAAAAAAAAAAVAVK